MKMSLNKLVLLILLGVLGLTLIVFFLVSIISSRVAYQKYYDSYQKENGGQAVLVVDVEENNYLHF